MKMINLIKIMKTVLLALVMLPLISSFAMANNCVAIYNNGDSQYMADIVIVGDNWPESALGEFADESKILADYLLTYPSYSNYSGLINIWYINQSADLGCSGPVCDNNLVRALASQCPYDKIYVYSNDSGYFGGGAFGGIAVGSRHPIFKEEIFVHEMGGHTFGQLLDEYSTSSLFADLPPSIQEQVLKRNCATPEEADYQGDNTPCSKWSDIPGTGCYIGCTYADLYRSSLTSIMKEITSTFFNLVSQRSIRIEIDNMANLTSGANPSSDQSIELGESVSFDITKTTNLANVKWLVNDTEALENQDSFVFLPEKEGNYSVKAIISYSEITESYSWNVNVIDTNTAPSITNYSPLDENVNVNENSSISFEVTAEDLENDYLNYSWKLNGKEKSKTQNWIYTPGFSESGVYNVTATVFDHSRSVSHSWNLTVNNVNRIPIITSTPQTIATANHAYEYSIYANDPDGDALNYSLLVYPQGMSIESGKISWTPESSQIGLHNVTVKASDYASNATQQFTINVSENKAPVLEIGDLMAYEGETIKLNPVSSDPENDSVSYIYSGWMDSDTKSAGYNDEGAHTVNVKASDGYSADEKNITVTVLNSYKFMTAVADINTKQRLSGTVKLNESSETINETATAIFDYIHSDTEYTIIYESSGYKTDSYPIYLDNRLTECSEGADCQFSNEYATSCKWDSQHSGWLCEVAKDSWKSMFVYVPAENAVKRVEYMAK